jgi:hypothetical protein
MRRKIGFWKWIALGIWSARLFPREFASFLKEEPFGEILFGLFSILQGFSTGAMIGTITFRVAFPIYFTISMGVGIMLILHGVYRDSVPSINQKRKDMET